MKSLLKFFLITLVLGILTTPIFATNTPPVFNSAISDCTQVVVNFQPSNFDTIVLRVETSGVPISNEFTIPPANPSENRTLIMPLTTSQPNGTVLQIRWRYSFSALWNNFGTSFACEEVPDEIPVVNTMPWELLGGQDAYMSTAFATDENGDPLLILLSIDNDSNGILLFSLTASALEAEYPCTGETYTIFESEDRLYYLIRQGDCNLQLLVGPDFENKMHYVIIDGIPPTTASSNTYFLSIEARKLLFSLVP